MGAHYNAPINQNKRSKNQDVRRIADTKPAKRLGGIGKGRTFALLVTIIFNALLPLKPRRETNRGFVIAEHHTKPTGRARCHQAKFLKNGRVGVP